MAMLPHRLDGDGEPLLLLNGGLMSLSAWDSVVPFLAPRFRVIRCDFRGQFLALGLGTPPATLAGHAADLAELLDHLGVPAVHVVGTSFGALVAMEFAAAFPARTRTVTLTTATDRVTAENHLEANALRAAVVDAARGGDGRVVLDLLGPLTFSPEWLEGNRETYAARREQFSLLPPAWYAGLDALLGALVDFDAHPLLARVSAPTFILAAECDRIFPVERSRALAAGIPAATLEIAPGAAHGFAIEHPQAFAAAILRFLESPATRGLP